MITRRHFAKAVAPTAFFLYATAKAAPVRKEINKPRQYQSHQESCLPTSSAPWPASQSGEPPTERDLDLALRFLNELPVSASPIDAARTIAASNAKSSSGELFRRRWKVKSNPLIPWYFTFTDEAPCNDTQLDWCAAFASWALVQSGRERLPFADVAGNIAALKKRAYANPFDAKPGDLIFLTRNGGGHVGFLERWKSGSAVSLIGGNQSERDSVSSVSEQEIPIGAGAGRQIGLAIPIDAFAKLDRAPPAPQTRSGLGHLLATAAARDWPSAK
jgi:hypothetical protein